MLVTSFKTDGELYDLKASPFLIQRGMTLEHYTLLLPDRFEELPRDREIVAHCKSGKRSAQAVQLLRRAGFTNVVNVAGGIEAWANEIDPAMPKY